MTVEMQIKETKPVITNLEAREMAKDALRRQCKECKLGDKMGPRSGCEVRKKLILDDNDVAWKNKHLFFDGNGKCKMYKD